jgi:ubiquinone/menaquinone biosynthesis C-methylase UbiE
MTRRKFLKIAAGALAFVLVAGGAVWLNRRAIGDWLCEGAGRDRWQQPDEVLRALIIARGARVADIGSGRGYFTFRFARAVGESGKVYAVDIDHEVLRAVRERAEREGVANIETIFAKTDDALLPAGGVDLIFLCNTYHHISNRVEYFRRVRAALAPRGRLAVIELRGEGWFARRAGHSTTREALRTELEAAGFRLSQQHDFLRSQHFLIFVATEGPIEK